MLAKQFSMTLYPALLIHDPETMNIVIEIKNLIRSLRNIKTPSLRLILSPDTLYCAELDKSYHFTFMRRYAGIKCYKFTTAFFWEFLLAGWGCSL